jgi:hypothetical protein
MKRIQLGDFQGYTRMFTFFPSHVHTIAAACRVGCHDTVSTCRKFLRLSGPPEADWLVQNPCTSRRSLS